MQSRRKWKKVEFEQLGRFYENRIKMLPTGDIQGGLRKLETLLRVIKYTGNVDYNSLSNGDPTAFLPILGYTLTSFSPVVAEQLLAAGVELTGKTDLRFTETVYKVLRDIFQYKPILTKEQFLQWGFSQRKMSVVCDIISMVLKRHNQHKKVKPKAARFPASHKKNVKIETIYFSDTDNALSAKPYVVNHLENPPTIPMTSSHKEPVPSQRVTYTTQVEAYTSDSLEHGIVELRGTEDEAAENQCCANVEERLSALETRLESLSVLDRIGTLEKRLEELESLKHKDKREGQVITVSKETWENLLSRVLLLETKLELSNAKENVPLPCPVSPPSFAPKALIDASQLSVRCPASKENGRKEVTLTDPDDAIDLKERLERITNMLKSTSSLLKNTDSTTTTYT